MNARVAQEDRRIPMPNMIYVADGPSDVPVFSLLMTNGAETWASTRTNTTIRVLSNSKTKEGSIAWLKPTSPRERQRISGSRQPSARLPTRSATCGRQDFPRLRPRPDT